MDRNLHGESAEALAEDYNLNIDAIRAVLEVRPYEHELERNP